MILSFVHKRSSNKIYACLTFNVGMEVVIEQQRDMRSPLSPSRVYSTKLNDKLNTKLLQTHEMHIICSKNNASKKMNCGSFFKGDFYLRRITICFVTRKSNNL